MLLRPVFVWPDGTWCEADELEAYLSFMSDDFCVVQVPEAADWDQTEDLVQQINTGLHV